MTARAVLFEAQKSGADYAELYLEDKESTQIEMLDGKVETANYTRVCGAGEVRPKIVKSLGVSWVERKFIAP